MKKLKVIIFVLLFFTGLVLPSVGHAVFAADCIGNYFSFLNKVSNQYTRRDYVGDFFTLSYCQVSDMLEVYDQIDSIRDQFRSTAMICGNTAQYEATYKSLLMEIYFIRELARQDTSGLTDEEVDNVEAQKTKILSELKSEMEAAFVDDVGFVDSGTFNQYFAIWSERYNDKVVSYRRCENGPWWELQDSWNDFKKTWQEIGENLKNTKSQFDKPETTFGERLLQPIKSTVDAWKAKKEQQDLEETKDVEAEKTISDVVQEQGVTTFQSVLDALTENSKNYTITSDSAERMARYKELYGEGGSLAASNMQGIIQTMNAVVTDASTNYLPEIEDATKKVVDKECN